MLKRLVLASLALGALASAARAQGFAEPTGSSKPAPKAEKADKAAKKQEAKEAPPEVGDDMLDRERSLMDARFAARVGAIKADADRRSAFHALAEKKRFEFERHSAEERKAFYLYLRSVSAEERPGRLKEFDERQESARQRFDRDQLGEAKAWFNDEVDSHWRSTSLMEQSIPSSSRAEAAPSAAPKASARRPAIAKKPKAAPKKRRSRIAREAPPQEAPPPAQMDQSGGGPTDAANAN